MTNSKLSKRRRRESSVRYSSDSTEEDSVSDGKEYYHKIAKGKRKLREDYVQDQQEEENKEVEPPLANVEKAVQVCGICLTEEEVERGKLDCCDHYFCFGCIMEWAKVESRCPTCKQRFVTIVRPSVPGVPRSRTRTFHIPHRNQVYEPSEEEIRLFTDPYLFVVCTECQEAGDEGLLLLCDGCDAAAHTYCVGLGQSVPRGDWFCNTCSIQVQGFNSDEQEQDEGYNEEQEAKRDEDDSSTMLTINVADVQPIQRRQPPLRAAASHLDRASGSMVNRHTRLHPAPVSQEAQSLILSAQGANRSSSFSSGVESTPAVARTLSSQRLIRQRVNDFRNNWDQLRRGEVQFGSISHSAPRTRASQAGHNQANVRLLLNTTSAVPEAASSDVISQAWSIIEQARAARGDGIPDSSPVSRASGNRDGSHGRALISGVGTEGRSSRFSRTQEQTSRTETAREGNQLVESSPRDHREQTQEQTLRREDLRERNHFAESRLRGRPDRAQEQSSRRENARVNSHLSGENRSRNHRDRTQELRNVRGENARESNRLVESRSSGHRRGRSGGRRDNDSVHDVQEDSMRELRISMDANEGNVEGRSIPGSSIENERLRVVDRSGRRRRPEDQLAHRPRIRRTSKERREMKEQVAHYVKAELKPLYRLGHIDKQQHIRIARSATQELLVAFGIEHLGPETRAFGSFSSACTHLSATSSSLIPNCCMQCVRHNVSKVVGVLVKKTVGNGIL